MQPRLCFEQVAAGMEIPALSKGPMTTMHIMRWSAASENWHRIHYDHPFATGHDGLSDVVVNGSWRQHVLVQLLKDWAGPEGWLWKIRFQFRDDAADAGLFVSAGQKMPSICPPSTRNTLPLT